MDVTGVRSNGATAGTTSARIERMPAAELTQLDPGSDPVIERYKQDIDRTLIRENLRKSHEERLLTLQRMQRFVDELHAAGKTARRAR